jgi:RNA polymerase sigma-70 factor (sigma-E family)
LKKLRGEPEVSAVFPGVGQAESQVIAARTESASEGRERLEELYARHLPEAQRLAYLLVGNAHLAEDIAQEAFVRLAGRFRHLRNPDAFGAYLRRTVVNLCRGHFRRSRVERTYLQRTGGPDPAPPADEHLTPDLVGAIRELPHRQRAAVVLRYYEDLSESETAEVLHCSRKAVNGLVARAMETLRRRVGNEER